jgi:hypothetical protein
MSQESKNKYKRENQNGDTENALCDKTEEQPLSIIDSDLVRLPIVPLKDSTAVGNGDRVIGEQSRRNELRNAFLETFRGLPNAFLGRFRGLEPLQENIFQSG